MGTQTHSAHGSMPPKAQGARDTHRGRYTNGRTYTQGTLRQTQETPSHMPAPRRRYSRQDMCRHTQRQCQTQPPPCTHTHTHLPQAPGTAPRQVSWNRDCRQPAMAGRCPREQCLPSSTTRQTQGAIVSLTHTTGHPLDRLSWRLCLPVGAEGWQLPRLTWSHGCGPAHLGTPPSPQPPAWSCRARGT